MSIFLSRSKAWCNTTTGACTCPERETSTVSAARTPEQSKAPGDAERKQKLWHSPQTYVSLSLWDASLVCWLYKTIPHSIPWRLAGAPVSCRRQTCGTGSWLDTWGSNLCHSHWRAQLLCRGRTGLSHSPVGRGYWWVRPLMSNYWPQMAAKSDVQFRYYWHRPLGWCFPSSDREFYLWIRLIRCFLHKMTGPMSAFLKRYLTTIPLKPILPWKPRDYSYKSLMSRVLHKPLASQPTHSALCFTMTSTTQANHWWCWRGCPAVLSYSGISIINCAKQTL